MSLSVFSERDIFPEAICFLSNVKNQESSDFLLKVYYAILSHSALSLDAKQQLCVDKHQIMKVLQIDLQVLDYALFHLRRLGYVELIRLALRIYENQANVPKDMSFEVANIRSKMQKFRKLTAIKNNGQLAIM